MKLGLLKLIEYGTAVLSLIIEWGTPQMSELPHYPAKSIIGTVFLDNILQDVYKVDFR